MFHAEIKSDLKEDISILISLDNHSRQYLCDCGEASGLTVKECQNLGALFISHTHIDHFVNFDTILRHQIGIEREVIICGPRNIARQIQARIKSYTWNLIETGAIAYQIREIQDNDIIARYRLEPPHWDLVQTGTLSGNQILNNKDFEVTYVSLDHKLPSIAYLFREPDTVNIDLAHSAFTGGPWVRELKKAYQEKNTSLPIRVGEESYPAEALFHLLAFKTGDTLGVIMDHAANAANHARIRSLFSDCRQVFIESFYREADQQLATTNFHSYSTASGAVMRACGVAEAVPVHFSRKYEAEDVAQLCLEFEKAFRHA